MNKIHCLKIWPAYFNGVAYGNKNFEVRKNDRDFKVGDILVLQEYVQPTTPPDEPDNGYFTDNVIAVMVTGVWDLSPWCPGYVGMSITKYATESGE